MSRILFLLLVVFGVVSGIVSIMYAAVAVFTVKTPLPRVFYDVDIYLNLTYLLTAVFFVYYMVVGAYKEK